MPTKLRLVRRVAPEQLDLAEPAVAEAKLELVCQDDLADQLVALIGQAGRPGPGCVFATDVGLATKIQ